MPDPIALVPRPQSVTWTEGTWTPSDPWSELDAHIAPDLPPAEYRLSVTPAGARLLAGSEPALVNGRSTFGQLVEGSGGTLPAVSITDRPAYEWRGVHVDPCRHFFDLTELRRLIDVFALLRLNVVHLHLTDDQGWRMEIDGYPRLTEVGAFREHSLIGHGGTAETDPETARYDDVPVGGFYTQSELRDLVAYAAERGITIVPEIDLPGHMRAAIAAYPTLGNHPDRQLDVWGRWGIADEVLGVSDEVFAFLRAVLEQVCDVFPSPYVHIGGDECPRTEWEDSPAVATRMAEWGLSDVSEVQGKFTQFAYDVLTARGKTVVGWDEVMESPLPDDLVVMNWRGEKGVAEAIGRGFRTVVSSSEYLYLDHYQGDPETEPLAIGGHTTLEDVYTATLVPEDASAEQLALIEGVQGQLWTEYVPTPEHLEYMYFPRMLAVAERAWGSPAQSYAEFEERVRAFLPLLDARDIRYRPLD